MNASSEPEKKISNGNWIVYVSTFPPRKCGIATFTYDLTRAMDTILEPSLKSRIVAMNVGRVAGYKYGKKVIHQINQENTQEYIEVAEKLNKNDSVKVVNIQHEFGIFGGELGSNVIDFLRTLTKPKVITLHTVLPEPSEILKDTVRLLADNCDVITVMTQLSRSILIKEYKIVARKIRIIPHGIHERPYTSSETEKRKHGFYNKTVLTTFGMLNRGKGLEYVIEGLPAVLNKYKDFVYIIVGATHPSILRVEGEAYRNSLIRRIYELGLSEHVKLYNKYYSLDELLDFLTATDIYISTSIDPNQAVSGTLSYAMGIGRPIISTPFAHAREIVTNDVGILVDFKNSDSFTDAIARLLEDEEWRLNLGKNAYFKTRSWTWPNIAIKYANTFSELNGDIAGIIKRKSIPQIKLVHLQRLTDDFGIVQFARLSQPDLSSGYTLDDNARALMAVALYYDRLNSESKSQLNAYKGRLLKLINIYLSFIELSSRQDIYFNNYFTAGRIANEERNKPLTLEESSGRALFALALASSTRSLPKKISGKAFTTLQDKLRKNVLYNSPRAIAWFIKAICVLMDKNISISGIDLQNLLKQQCNRLVSFYEDARTPEWEWFERYLTYSNGLLSEALLQAYQITGEGIYLDVGKTTLDFLTDTTFKEDIHMPVGQDGWSYRDGEHNHFDQQPEAVMAMVYALKACYIVTGEGYYKDKMYLAFNWFLGNNSLDQIIYDRTTGGCYDGVREKGINLNQGAESTISYLLARLAV